MGAIDTLSIDTSLIFKWRPKRARAISDVGVVPATLVDAAQLRPSAERLGHRHINAVMHYSSASSMQLTELY